MDLQINLLIIENVLFFFHSIKFQTQFLIAIFRDICEIICLLEFFLFYPFLVLRLYEQYTLMMKKMTTIQSKELFFLVIVVVSEEKCDVFLSRSLMLVGTLTTNEEKKTTLCEYYCYFTFHSFECVRFGVTFTHYTNTIH